MYARVQLTVDTRANALTVPRNAIVDFEGKQGVFVAGPAATGTSGATPAANTPPAAMTAKFVPVEVGIRDGEQVEVRGGINDGTRVVTTGAGALRDGDRIVPSGQDGERGGRGRRGDGGTQPPGSNR